MSGYSDAVKAYVRYSRMLELAITTGRVALVDDLLEQGKPLWDALTLEEREQYRNMPDDWRKRISGEGVK